MTPTSRIAGLLASLIFVGGAPAFELPDGPHKDVATRLCSTCHSPDIVLGRGLTREQWSEVVSNMISKGAKGSPDEFNQVVDYLAATLPPGSQTSKRQKKPQGGLSAGPADRHIVDEASAALGKAVYYRECITCHGPDARGAGPNAAPNQRGPDLVRSQIVLHDRYGDRIGPFLKQGHPMQSGALSSSLNAAQIEDLADFLHARFEDTLHRTPFSQPLNVLTGDPKAGEAFFNGAGQCNTCHSPTGDLAHIASKYNPPALQLRFLFPKNGRASSPSVPETVTVTQSGGQSVSGDLIHIDDFTVSLRDKDGQYHSFARDPGLNVEKHDPYQAHIESLDRYTNKDMHDIVAYLETLK